jgi:uncharacterized protein (TIGR02246 family)
MSETTQLIPGNSLKANSPEEGTALAQTGVKMEQPQTALSIVGLDAMETGDRKAIATTIGQALTGFALRNADIMSDVYSDDADWVNAFGSVKHGNAEIINYLRGLFADANFNDGKPVAPPELSLRRLNNDNVVVSCHLQVTGQGLVGGGSIALRDNRSLHVVSRQNDGSWRIVSAMFMDARQDQSYAGHS